ncbi:MAG: 3-phosphoshikimate 1-carboxyvinyltransferase [Dehalococcoidia bacterium]|nr:3-phosphoshikimate 1-carboxyvinyltransferase [Dehalococcoidia bacterium]
MISSISTETAELRSVQAPARLAGEITVPGDKSISHRAILLNAIATGAAHVTGAGLGADCRASIASVEALGATVRRRWPDGSLSAALAVPDSARSNGAVHRAADLVIEGAGGEGLHEPADVLDAANSGTTARLLSGILAGRPFFSVLTGDASLRRRPMGRVIEPLTAMGARIVARNDNRFLPMALSPARLQAIEYELPVASAQLKSSLLLAGLQAAGTTVLHEPAASRDHTERMLRAQGASLLTEDQHLTLEGDASLEAVDVAVPGDISSAAFWLVAALVHPQARITIRGVGINPGRTGLLDVLIEMGGSLTLANRRQAGGEPVADITAESSHLRGARVGGELIPRLLDEVPILALAAVLAEGTTTIHDAAELRVKESDRLAAVARELTVLGGQVEELPDGLVIRGKRGLAGGKADAHSDHRLAMMACIAGLVSADPVLIGGTETVEVSYPGFWHDLERLAPGAARVV